MYTFPCILVSDQNKKSIGRSTNFDCRKHLTQLGKNMKEISEVPDCAEGSGRLTLGTRYCGWLS
jgi:hypothetical protein